MIYLITWLLDHFGHFGHFDHFDHFAHFGHFGHFGHFDHFDHFDHLIISFFLICFVSVRVLLPSVACLF